LYGVKLDITQNTLGLCENRVLRRKFKPKREEVAGGWRTLHNEELHNLYASPNIIRVIKSRKMRCAGHVARIGDKKGKVIPLLLLTEHHAMKAYWGNAGIAPFIL